MKIEFLNDDLTEARLTRGWFRKEYAIVRKMGSWYFVTSGGCRDNYVGGAIDVALDDKADRLLRKGRVNGHWRPVERLPQARLLAKGTP